MSDSNAMPLAYSIGALILVASALFSYRLRLGEAARMAAIWGLIFVVLIILLSFREEAGAVWNRVYAQLSGSDLQVIDGNTVRLRQRTDGHFWAIVSANGNSAEFLIDSGATTTALNPATAAVLGASVDKGGFPVAIDTANGTVFAQRGRLASLQVAAITMQDLPIIVAEEFGDTNVIGMNFLSRLSSWRVEGSELILEP
jgi:aspartyl protease family protein